MLSCNLSHRNNHALPPSTYRGCIFSNNSHHQAIACETAVWQRPVLSSYHGHYYSRDLILRGFSSRSLPCVCSSRIDSSPPTPVVCPQHSASSSAVLGDGTLNFTLQQPGSCSISFEINQRVGGSGKGGHPGEGSSWSGSNTSSMVSSSLSLFGPRGSLPPCPAALCSPPDPSAKACEHLSYSRHYSSQRIRLMMTIICSGRVTCPVPWYSSGVLGT